MGFFIRQYSNSQNTLLNMLTNNNSQMMNFLTDGVQLSNAYLFGQQIINNQIPLNTTANIPMWFATNASSVNELSASQEWMMGEYKQLSLFIDSVLFRGTNNFVYAWGLYMIDNSDNSSIYFEYPSRYKSPLTNLTTNVRDSSFN